MDSEVWNVTDKVQRRPGDFPLYIQQDVGSAKEENQSELTAVNFVLIFGIMALALLTIRAVLMKSESLRCWRKNTSDEVPRSCVPANAVRTPLNYRLSRIIGSNGRQLTALNVRSDQVEVYVVPNSPPPYDNDQQYPDVAPPPYTPGDPSPSFVEDSAHQGVFTAQNYCNMSALLPPPPYSGLPKDVRTQSLKESDVENEIHRDESVHNAASFIITRL